jgi:hypothetical protein
VPFKSAKQERYLWANHPELARKWKAEAGKKRKKVKKRKKPKY